MLATVRPQNYILELTQEEMNSIILALGEQSERSMQELAMDREVKCSSNDELYGSIIDFLR